MSDQRMTVTRIPTEGGSSVDPPFDHNWDDLTKLQWQAAVTALDTGLAVSIERAGVRRRRSWGWQDIGGLFNVRCGASSSGPFDYNQADYVLRGISIGTRESQRSDGVGVTEIGERLGDWIQLISGKPFWPLDPRPEEIELDDIAWSLSMQCRYAGHVKRYFSVAEHSVMVSRLVPEEHALWGLLHDATEAYLVDLPRPVKRSMPDYRLHEDHLAEVIAGRFGLPWPMPTEVKQVDMAMLFVERGQLLAEPRREWGLAQGGDPINLFSDVVLPCWSPNEAYRAFLQRFAELDATRLARS